jgi:hypothetical protein
MLTAIDARTGQRVSSTGPGFAGYVVASTVPDLRSVKRQRP